MSRALCLRQTLVGWTPHPRHQSPSGIAHGALLRGGGQAHGFASDARKEEQVAALVEQIERDIAPIEVMVFNIGANVPCSILDETARKYFKIWEMACFSAFLVGREVAKRMVVRGHGTIIFTGATAGLRGSANFAAFAGAKHALRALAQSMVRELDLRPWMERW